MNIYRLYQRITILKGIVRYNNKEDARFNKRFMRGIRFDYHSHLSYCNTKKQILRALRNLFDDLKYKRMNKCLYSKLG